MKRLDALAKEVMAACADAAAAVQRRYFTSITAADVTVKSRRFDLQTVADTESERAIVARIRAAFPEHAILTEEAGAITHGASPVTWVIDPLDGTLNFRHGIPAFAISIAVMVEGEAQLATVFNPVTHERYEAERGKGSTLNGQPIHVSQTAALEDSLMVMGLPYDRCERIDHYLAHLRAFTLASQRVLLLGSAALDLCNVAAGRFAGYFEESLSLWDWAAGMLIVEEAGGTVTDYTGGRAMDARKELCVSNGRIHAPMLELLAPERDAQAGTG